MLKPFIALLLLLGPAAMAQAPTAASPPAPAQPVQPPDGAEYWTASDQRMTFTAAGISFPRRVGAVSLERSIAFEQNNIGLDNGLIYASDDEALIATAFVYLPGLANDGLTALATEHFMRIQSGAGFRLLGSRVTAAGGRDGVAIRADYAGFRDAGEASSAAFVEAGGWIVKLRVSGPEARRADVERTMTALLADMRFEGAAMPRAAAPIALADCPPAAPSPAASAALLAPAANDAMEDAMMVVGEGMTHATLFAPRWCVSSLRRVGPYTLPILRALPAAPAEDSRRSVAVAILNDSSGMVEVVERRFHNRSRFVLLHHSTGQTRVLGSYDGMPSDAQLNAVLDGTDRAGGQARATISYHANGNSNVTLNIAP
jgi:hypothetical protein